MKIKCVKMQCPVCHITGSAQLFLNKNDELRYARVRHYKGLNQNKKPQFNYHKIEDLETLMKALNIQFPKPKPKEFGQVGQDCMENQAQFGQVISGLNLKNKPANMSAFTLKRC